MHLLICQSVLGLWVFCSQQQCQQVSSIIILTLTLFNYLPNKVVKDSLVFMDMKCFERMHPRPKSWKHQECNIPSVFQKRVNSLERELYLLQAILINIINKLSKCNNNYYLNERAASFELPTSYSNVLRPMKLLTVHTLNA